MSDTQTSFPRQHSFRHVIAAKDVASREEIASVRARQACDVAEAFDAGGRGASQPRVTGRLGFGYSSRPWEELLYGLDRGKHR